MYTGNEFFLLTLVAGVVFGGALFWTIAQWLNADESIGAIEQEIQQTMGQNMQRGRLAMATPGISPGGHWGSASPQPYLPIPDVEKLAEELQPAVAEPEAAEVVAEVAEPAEPMDLITTTDDEVELGRYLLVWGSATTALGMAIGWAWAGPSAGLGGALFGSALGVFIGTLSVALKRKARARQQASVTSA